MILDYLLQFTGGVNSPGNSDSATDSPTTGTQTSSNMLDLHISGGGLPVLANLQGARDMGIGDAPSLKILVEVTTTFLGGTNLVVNFQGAPDNGSGAAGSFVTYFTGPTVLEASLIQGARLYEMDVPRPPPGTPFPRFLSLQYVTSGTHTSGKLRGFIVIDRHDQPLQSNAVLGAYPPGIVIAN